FRSQKKLGAFVAPNVQAGLNRLEGYSSEAYAPAYIKEKDVVDINLPLFRLPGEAPITGSLSNEQRRQAWITELSAQHRRRIHNRFEWMAAQAAITGQITIESKRYPKAVLDFGRDANLTSAPDWKTTTTSANPMKDIKDQRVLSN